MQRTSWVTLGPVLAVCLVAGVVAGVQYLNVMPPLSYLSAVCLGGVTAVLLWWGWTVKQAVADNRIGQDRSQLSPLTVVRVVALAKASALLGAGTGGCAGGYAIALGIRRGEVSAAATDFPVAVVITCTAVALLVAALVVETWCQLPPGSDEDLEALADGSAA